MQSHKRPSFFSHSPRSRAAQRGITLVEWMVSITIGLVLVTGLLVLFAQQSQTQNELQKSSRQIENGRYAMQLLREDIQLAGYWGEFSNTASLTVPTVLPNPCATLVADLSAALPFAVQGADAPGASLPAEFATCPLQAANHIDGTDILVVRHADAAVVAGNLTAGQTYLQSGIKNQALNFVIDQATGVTLPATFDLQKNNGTAGAVRKYLVHVYYVSPCSVPKNGNSTCSTDGTDDGGVSVPTLKRLELSVVSDQAKFTNASLVEGIENMQIDYGVDTPSGDGAPDGNFVPNPAVADWANVMALRIHLLARNNEMSGDYDDQKTYQLGLSPSFTPPVGNERKYKRHVFSQLIRVVNPSSRREQ